MANSVCSSSYEAEVLPELEDELEDEAHFEDEGEEEGEGEEEISPIRKVYSDAVMEHLGELAAEAESEDEAAEHFLPLIGMAASKLLPVVARAIAPAARRALPGIAKAVTRLTPRLTKGVGSLARTLHRNPSTRPLLRAVPTIARKTIHSIARQAAHHRPITARSAIRTLAKQTQRVLGHGGRRHHTLRRHHNLDRRFHRRWGRGYARPHSGTAGVTYRGGYYAGGGGVPATYHAAAGGGVVPSGGHAVAPGVPGAGGGVRPGRMVSGQCVCPSCSGGASAAPNYCRCCGQVLR